MKSKTAVLITFLFMGLVILPGLTISSDSADTPTMGCGKPTGDTGNWLNGSNVAHLYFHQVDALFDGKNDKESWAKMSYTYCGVPSRFVFNGHGLEREELYALIAVIRIPDEMMMPQPGPVLLGEAQSNGGGNVHIKGELFLEGFFAWDLYLVRAGVWEELILAADEPVVWTAECVTDGVCDEGVLLATLSGENVVPPVMTEASGNALLYDNGTGSQLAYILKASEIGTVIGAYINYGAAETNGSAVATLYEGSDNSGEFLTAGMVTEAALMGDFAGSPVSTLIEAMDEGMTYVSLLTETRPAGEIRGQIERIDIGGFCHGEDDDWDDICMKECLEECLDINPDYSKYLCKDECQVICDNNAGDDRCAPAVDPMDPFYERFEGISSANSCETDDDCVVGGCSGEVCAAQPAVTTCELLPYKPAGGCLCVEGICQWAVCIE